MSRRINEMGNVYGRLTVVGDGGKNERNVTLWLCECECGNKVRVPGTALRHGNNKSCGCLQRENFTTHGMYRTPSHRSWSAMRSRCLSPNVTGYDRYGGSGISICDRWSDFKNFYEDMGERPEGMSLDRIDNKGDYTPENCKWSTREEQQRNRSSVMYLKFNDEVLCIPEWAEKTGISCNRIYSRIAKGWSVEEALTIAVKSYSKKVI